MFTGAAGLNGKGCLNFIHATWMMLKRATFTILGCNAYTCTISVLLWRPPRVDFVGMYCQNYIYFTIWFWICPWTFKMFGHSIVLVERTIWGSSNKFVFLPAQLRTWRSECSSGLCWNAWHNVRLAFQLWSDPSGGEWIKKWEGNHWDQLDFYGS